MSAARLRLPITHARDWLSRYDGDESAADGYGVETVEHTARTITFTLSAAALCDLISDALYYSEEMDREATGDRDYRPPARTCLAAIERAGVVYTRRGFSVELVTVGMEAER